MGMAKADISGISPSIFPQIVGYSNVMIKASCIHNTSAVLGDLQTHSCIEEALTP